MPPRRRAAPVSESLTPDDIKALTTALAEGKRATVYVREGTPSLGLKDGASARVLSISGTTLTVKPSGVDDELPYEADELRITKNPPPPPPEEPKRAAAASKTTAAKPVATVSTIATKPPVATKPTVAAKPATPSTPKPPRAASPATATPATATPTKAVPARKPVRRATAKKPPAAVTVTIHGSADNEWSVAVTRGGRKLPRSRSVTPDSVESAMAELGDEQAQAATSSILNAAREDAQRRVDELSRELAAAQEALAILDGAT